MAGFQWDDAKIRSKIEKHGVYFADAVRIFARPPLDSKDNRWGYGEPRVNSIGDLDGIVIINVTHTDRSSELRLISARLANRLERELYERFARESRPPT